MKYPVAIQKDKDSCYGVTVPDIPGCFSAGESLDEAMNNVQEAISSHLEILAEDQELAPNPEFSSVQAESDSKFLSVNHSCLCLLTKHCRRWLRLG